jgi:hypothetical protein
VLKGYLALRLRIEIFMNEQGKVMAEPSDEKWPRDLAFLYIIQHLNDLMLNFMVSTTNF